LRRDEKRKGGAGIKMA